MNPPFGAFFPRHFSPLAAAVFSVLLAANAVRAADWPQWRGPNRDGVSTETIPSAPWAAEGPKVLWKANFGPGCSAFSVVGNRAFTMGNEQDTGAVICLDVQTGQVIWKHTFPSKLDPKMFDGGQCATPTVDGDLVFALGRQGQFFCLNKSTGALVWSKDIVGEFGAKLAAWGYACSPLIVGDKVILEVGAPGTSAVAFEKATGKVAWQAGDDPQSYASPLLFTHEGKSRLAFFNVAGLVVRDAASGQEVMRYPWKTKYDINAATPLVADGKVFIASGYDHGAALLPLGEANPTPLWETKSMRNRMNSCVLVKGHLYGFDEGTFTCMEFVTGTVKWQQKGLGMGSLIVAGDKLLIQAEDGNLVVAEPSPETYKELARTPAVSKKTWVIPVLSNGKIFCRSNSGEAVCFDVTGS